MSNLTRLKNLKKGDVTAGRIIKALWRRIEDLPHKMIWNLPTSYTVRNRIAILKFKNIHAGKRCFIIANGPSLKHIDFSLLKNEYTIGMNRIYMMKEQSGFSPTYLACIDIEAQLLQFREDFDNLEMPVFYNWKVRNKFSRKNNQHFIRDTFSPAFSYDLAYKGFGTGRSVTYLTMQLAYYMGFTEVYLIGKDHSYNTSEKTGTAIKSTGKEENHFITGYYKPGMKWFSPDLASEEFAYALARKAFEKDGRIIKDATVNGKLAVFEKIDFHSLFSK